MVSEQRRPSPVAEEEGEEVATLASEVRSRLRSREISRLGSQHAAAFASDFVDAVMADTVHGTLDGSAANEQTINILDGGGALDEQVVGWKSSPRTATGGEAVGRSALGGSGNRSEEDPQLLQEEL
ncbi:unnamed protein product, partial [Amoebophrya sp. A25]|eukprot:GSA25T00020915001.1